MIPRGVEIFVGLEPIDLRWSFDRLAGVVTESALGADGSGMCLFYILQKAGSRHISPSRAARGGVLERGHRRTRSR